MNHVQDFSTVLENYIPKHSQNALQQGSNSEAMCDCIIFPVGSVMIY